MRSFGKQMQVVGHDAPGMKELIVFVRGEVQLFDNPDGEAVGGEQGTPTYAAKRDKETLPAFVVRAR